MTGIILAAGVGARLGLSVPKGLLILPSKETILARQVRIMKAAGIQDIVVVVGFKKETVKKALSGVRFAFNPRFADTNTAKSLLCGLKGIDDDVLWVNGDVVFDEELIPMIVSQKHSSILVNTAECGEEEVKYIADDDGNVKQISKQLPGAQGEALGMNLIKCDSLGKFVKALARSDDHDYFERAVQDIIDQGVIFKRLSVSEYKCIEVDFEEDWKRAKEMFGRDG